VSWMNVGVAVALAGALIWRLVGITPQVFPLRKRLAHAFSQSLPSIPRLDMHELMRMMR
jgi:hypothetical protein